MIIAHFKRSCASEPPPAVPGRAVLAGMRRPRFHSGKPTGPKHTQWLAGFDGVSGNADKEIADPMGFGRLECACYLLAREVGIDMARSRLHEEGGGTFHDPALRPHA